MIRALLLCVALFQAGSPTAQKPIIENDRVAVWDVTDSPSAQPTDAVVVSLSGNAAFLPKGTAPKIDGRSMVIDLKDHPAPTYTNTTKYPLAFPRLEEDSGKRPRDYVGLHLDAGRGHSDALPR